MSASAINTEVVISPEDLAEAYSLHALDHPGLLLGSTQFDGTSFGSWKRTTTIALSTKSKLYFVDGTLAKPQPSSPDFKKWMKCHGHVLDFECADQNYCR